MTYYVNGSLVQLSPGEDIFVNSHQMHYGFSGNGEDCLFLCTLLNPALLSGNTYLEHLVRQVTEHPQWSFVHLTSETPWQREVLTLLPELYSCYVRKDSSFELMLEAIYFQIIARLYSHRPPVHTSRRESVANNQLTALKSMLTVIQSRYAEPLTLAEIARAGHLSVSACCRLFQKYLSRTPIEFLTEVRLNQSCTLLERSELSMTQIAAQSGFCNSSYFSERFRRQYGCSPSEYRKRRALSGRRQKNPQTPEQ